MTITYKRSGATQSSLPLQTLFSVLHILVRFASCAPGMLRTETRTSLPPGLVLRTGRRPMV